MEEHWFDALNKALLQRVSRQATLRAAAASVASLALGAVSGAEAKKNRKKRKKGKKDKDKPQKKCVPPPSTCSGGDCQEIDWAQDPEKQCRELNHCEFVCNQCDGDDPREFCILKQHTNNPEAHCCQDRQTCCDNRCCDEDEYCCDRGGGRTRICVDLPELCCPDDFEFGFCDLTETCCPGIGCVAGTECPDSCNQLSPTGASRVDGDCGCREGSAFCGGRCVDITGNESHCGGCGRVCAGDGMLCCDSACLDTRTDRNNCGVCGQDCPTAPGWQCCERFCSNTLANERHCGACGHNCLPGQSCCNGSCTDKRSDPAHCGGCDRSCDPGLACCNTVCYDPATADCCQDFTLCPTDGNSICCGEVPFCRSASAGCGP